MNKLTYDDKEYIFPASLDEMEFGTFENLESIKKNQVESARSYNTVILQLAEITGISSDDIWQMPKELVLDLFNACLFYFDFDVKGIQIESSFIIDGVEYSYSEDPNCPMDVWVDRDHVLENYPDEDKFSGVLAIMLRPTGEVYDFKNNDVRQKLFKKQPASKFIPLIGFFLTREKQLLMNLKAFSMGLGLATYQHSLLNSAKDTGGIKSLFSWRKVTLEALMPYYSTLFVKYLTSYHTCEMKMKQSGLI